MTLDLLHLRSQPLFEAGKESDNRAPVLAPPDNLVTTMNLQYSAHVCSAESVEQEALMHLTRLFLPKKEAGYVRLPL